MKKLVSFFEIPTADFYRAVQFYETVLNLKLNVFECDEEKMAFFPEEDGEMTGAVSYAPDFLPSNKGVLIHFRVEDMGAVLERICRNGGTIVRPKTKIEADNCGYFSLFTDSEGNCLGLYSDL